MRLRTHPGQESAGPMAITLGYQLKSMERHPVHLRVTSELLDCATMASLRMRELFHFNHHRLAPMPPTESRGTNSKDRREHQPDRPAPRSGRSSFRVRGDPPIPPS
jgi:hypothetical protein